MGAIGRIILSVDFLSRLHHFASQNVVRYTWKILIQLSFLLSLYLFDAGKILSGETQSAWLKATNISIQNKKKKIHHAQKKKKKSRWVRISKWRIKDFKKNTRRVLRIYKTSFCKANNRKIRAMKLQNQKNKYYHAEIDCKF